MLHETVYLIINNEHITSSMNIANKMNEYFSSVADLLTENNDNVSALDLEKLRNFTNNKIPDDKWFFYPLHHDRTSRVIHSKP